MFFAQVSKRVNGVARLGQMKFYIAHIQFIIISDGRLHHVIPIKLMKQTLAWLERILRRDYKPDFIQVGIFGHDIGNSQMTNVNGIERSEEKTDFHFLFLKLSYSFCASANDFSRSSLSNTASNLS